MESEKHTATFDRGLLYWGQAGTAVYLLTVVVVAANIGGFDKLTLNNLGDFLAGACAPIAALWLVLGFIQQGRELRNTARALDLQAEELAKSVEQARELVAVTRTQVEVEMAHAAQLRAESETRALPRLHLEITSTRSDGAGGRKYEVLLQNAGAAAHEVEISSDGAEIGPTSFQFLESGDGRRLTLQLHRDVILGRIEITYADGLSRRHVDCWSVKVEYKNGTPQLDFELIRSPWIDR